MAVQGYYYGDSGSGELPSAEAVLSKLKSDGTFDRIRKLCVAAVQEEPSYRAQKEHVEIISRRFLHNYRWKESTTKNEVRSKLRSFVLEEMKKPGVHVGASLDSLIDRALETKATDLLPTIKTAVEAMLQPTPPGNDGHATELGTSQSSTSSSMAPIVTAAASGSGQGSTAGSLELPIHLLEFSSSIPAKKEVSTAPRGTKVRPRPPAVAEKRDTIGGGGKMSGPASSSGRSSNREERNESLPAGVKEKHLQRESKRADNKPQSETEKEKEKEKRGEPLATFTGKQMTHEKTEAMHKATASGSRRMEKDGVSFDADVNEVVNSRDILSEKRATDGGGRRRKRRASQRDDSQIHRSGKPHVSAATKRPTWKRRAVLSSSSEEEEEEESCDEEPISSSDLEVQNSDSGERKGRASHHNEHQKSNLKRVREGARVRGQTTVRDCSVVITRYNRRVKPNRRYVSSDLYQHEEEDKEEESEEDEEEETDKDKENEDNEESEEEEEEDDIRIRESSEEKGQLPERENCTTGQEQPVAKRLRSRK